MTFARGTLSGPAAGAVHGAAALADRYLGIRRLTEELAAPLTAEDQMVQSTLEASPTKWHLAHTTWFFETFILLRRTKSYRAFDPQFTFLFNSYYKQLPDGHPNRAGRSLLSRPGLECVQAYRRHVDEHMVRLLEQDEAIAGLVELGINHEQQHQELIVTDIKHALWSNPLRPAYREDLGVSDGHAPQTVWVEFDEGVYEIGHAGLEFAFDNEMPRHKVQLNPFRLASRLVTNAEYLDFIRDGIYRRPELWLSDGWERVQTEHWVAPLYWERRGDEWLTYTLAGMRPVNTEEPICHISYYEADAFARWAGGRLPSEAEWEVAATRDEPAGNFLEDGRFHPTVAADGGGLQQLFGDAWEWTASPYVAYPGYRPAAGVLGEYNGKFMCNQLVLRGGACATPRSHIRATYRNFFPAHARWQFSGIRVAHDRD